MEATKKLRVLLGNTHADVMNSFRVLLSSVHHHKKESLYFKGGNVCYPGKRYLIVNVALVTGKGHGNVVPI